ncbi:MAG: ribosome maturation factor RimM [Clostridia bacterium]|nr:ribosome maturation factor RimM [Clostridia bacterium]
MNDKLTVAVILKPQGIRGEVKVKALCNSAEDLLGLKRVFIGGEEYSVLGARGQGDFAYIALRGVFDRNAAELLRGKEIEALRADMPELPEGTYYIADLTGCAVVTSSGESIGEVISVTPAHTDIYTLSTPKGEVSFAAAEGVIESVDTENKIITVNKKRFKEVSV